MRVRSFLVSVEGADGFAHILEIILRDRHVHRQHEHALELTVGSRQVLGEAECLEMMDGLAAPLDKGADPVLPEIDFQFVTPLASIS